MNIDKKSTESNISSNVRHPGKLIIISGIPGSGKTTVAQEEQAKLRSQGLKVVRVNRDDIRTFMFGEEYHYGDFPGWCEAKVTRLQLTLIDFHLREGFSVISDATNLHYRDSKGYIKIADELGLELEHIAIIVPLEVALARNAKRASEGGRNVPEEVIGVMWERQKKVLEAKPLHFPIDRIIGA